MEVLDRVKHWVARITEVGLLLVALGIVLQVLLGSPLPFFGNIVGNLIALVQQLGQQGLVGLIAIAIILWLFAKRRPD